MKKLVVAVAGDRNINWKSFVCCLQSAMFGSRCTWM